MDRHHTARVKRNSPRASPTAAADICAQVRNRAQSNDLTRALRAASRRCVQPCVCDSPIREVGYQDNNHEITARASQYGIPKSSEGECRCIDKTFYWESRRCLSFPAAE